MRASIYFSLLMFLFSSCYTIPKIELKDDFNLWGYWSMRIADEKNPRRPSRIIFDFKVNEKFSLTEYRNAPEYSLWDLMKKDILKGKYIQKSDTLFFSTKEDSCGTGIYLYKINGYDLNIDCVVDDCNLRRKLIEGKWKYARNMPKRHRRYNFH